MLWDVHPSHPGGGYLSQTPAQQHGIIPEFLCLQPYSFPARKQPSERQGHGWHSSLPQAAKSPPALQQRRLHWSSTALRLRHGQPCTCLHVLVSGDSQSPGSLSHTLTRHSHPGALVWDLLQLPTSGCCHPCPQSVPGQIARMKWLLCS